MSKCTEIREICGDYAFDVEYSKDVSFTMFFNSLRNAKTVKRCIEVDDSVPNAATAVDFVEVVRCKNCRYCETRYPSKTINEEPKEVHSCQVHWHMVLPDGYCSYGERKERE